MSCSSGTIKQLDMSSWKEQKKMFIIPSSILEETLRNAQSDVRNVHKQEWILYTHSKFILLFKLFTLIYKCCF